MGKLRDNLFALFFWMDEMKEFGRDFEAGLLRISGDIGGSSSAS